MPIRMNKIPDTFRKRLGETKFPSNAPPMTPRVPAKDRAITTAKSTVRVFFELALTENAANWVLSPISARKIVNESFQSLSIIRRMISILKILPCPTEGTQSWKIMNLYPEIPKAPVCPRHPDCTITNRINESSSIRISSYKQSLI